jgi:hypothetical protein
MLPSDYSDTIRTRLENPSLDVYVRIGDGPVEFIPY